MNKEIKYKGFTLAEVLITLMVIGIVATMTIPGFLSDTQDKEYVVALKKAYASGNQALQNLAMSACGSPNLDCLFGTTASIDDLTATGNLLAAKYSLYKNCKTTRNKGCFAKNYCRNYDKTNCGLNLDDYAKTYNNYRFITEDGVSIMLEWQDSLTASNNCNNNAGLTATSPTAKLCSYFRIDVNGPKPPNTYGRDTFIFLVTSNKTPLLYPYGGQELGSGTGNKWWYYNNTETYCTKNNKLGDYCAGRVMDKNWDIDY